MNIRKAQLKDIVDIVKLEESVFHESLGESFLYDEMSLNPFSKMFVIEDELGFVGYIGLRVDEQAELMNFAILPEKQHLGYGTSLMNYVLTLLKNEGISILTLEVRESNLKARSFYEKCGFTKSHTRKNYYKTEDAIVYMKEVNA
ncbi:MAG: ribosomal-protein-alanine N-acetyltransferase [Tenericutes bacterium GWC2_34_14]|nr:MAG: ribosomal-protein-alanine N-acetyltransferase [Tenericutes bacterium GWC2_34_14]OHE32917.1 MAG: ribosomal-protein-alanine N-acetyltransferase [Tenericutes bacterium GWE2_34_108]OHE36118.1 MAG: ribosomal-protein-alanine N-acetyltransferase [Tenericutes bacterium GWF1_35_14]OHE39341.1 MAG: ribosomal-protein-alanine N-acetyltransferase [Tenericutes bacterium GWF2_35_184]OHE43823.1 MAG: ribosomal-protein-alanine N-acetyltransferase [Tenericutes bacterium RIFOXYA12_FULL_35_10]OHE44614.1 MAG